MTTRYETVVLICAWLSACGARGSDTELDTSAASDCGVNETKRLDPDTLPIFAQGRGRDGVIEELDGELCDASAADQERHVPVGWQLWTADEPSPSYVTIHPTTGDGELREDGHRDVAHAVQLRVGDSAVRLTRLFDTADIPGWDVNTDVSFSAKVRFSPQSFPQGWITLGVRKVERGDPDWEDSAAGCPDECERRFSHVIASDALTNPGTDGWTSIGVRLDNPGTGLFAVYLIAGSWSDEPDDGMAVDVESVGMYVTELQSYPVAPPTPEPQLCGFNVAGIERTCDQGEYCHYEPGICGRNEISGTCEPIPAADDLCIAMASFEPVCGCDRNEYASSCAAAKAGTSVWKTGGCQ